MERLTAEVLTPSRMPETTSNPASITHLAVTSTFTAEAVVRSLEFWMDRLQIPSEVTLAPYAQVMQELLSPHSSLARNKTGLNVLIIRLEDWIREQHSDTSLDERLAHLGRVSAEFAAAVGVFRGRNTTWTLVYLCPLSSTLPEAHREAYSRLQSNLLQQLSVIPRVHCLTHADLIKLYPLADYEDARTDRLGHIPYTDEYSVAIATLLARRIAATQKLRHKVVVVDCDNTLWRGICGEEGAENIEISPEHLHFQRALVAQHDAGVLLCLCSKNNPDDVMAVFNSRPEMLLREEHVIGSRINWSAKSENLRSLATELDLSLDSFVFIDDSPMECAEVRKNCPEVLVLQLPDVVKEIPQFVDHLWAFDRVEVTEDSKQRTRLYRQNRERQAARQSSANLIDFIASLELQVDIAAMATEALPRVAELLQRTNQFNLTGVRHRAAEIESLCASEGLRSVTVRVRDRFGDYGLVGAVLFSVASGTLRVDAFVLSCRVLGRGVEHRIVNELGRIAQREGQQNIELRCRHGARNAPAREFLEQSLGSWLTHPVDRSVAATHTVYTVPVGVAERLSVDDLADAPQPERSEERKDNLALATDRAPTWTWYESVRHLRRLSDISREIRRVSRRRRALDLEFTAPRNSTEAAVADIFAIVLNLDTVGARDDFFELGGDSLAGVQVAARIASTLGLELPLQEFFAEPSVEQVARRLADAHSAASPIQRSAGIEATVLSAAQQRLWFIDQLEEGSPAYHIPVALHLVGELDPQALQTALDQVLQRHAALRTVFKKHDDHPTQHVCSDVSFVLAATTDSSSLTAEHRDRQWLRQSREEVSVPFDLGVGPLIRGKLFKFSDRESILLVTVHHIVFDGWSTSLFIRDLSHFYAAVVSGRPARLPHLPIQYSDYALWQQREARASRTSGQLEFWKQHLQGAPVRLELPADRPRPAVQSYRGSEVPMKIEGERLAGIRRLARRLNLTVAMVLHAAWCVVLSRLSGQDDIVVGVPVANRRRTELEGLIGFFVNTLAVRLRLESDPLVDDLLRDVKDTLLQAYAHQDAPFEQVVEALQPVRSLSYSPIFQVMFALQIEPRDLAEIPGLTLEQHSVPLQTAQFDLLLSLQESSQSIHGFLNYATDLFDRETIERWVDSLTCVLDAMTTSPQLTVSQLPLLRARQLEEMLVSRRAENVPAFAEQLIHEVFDERVRNAPRARAVTCEHEELTYEQLNLRANQLAHELRARGVGPDQRVAICADRSLELVIGILGILKAGGAYVPLDPKYPPERLAYILEDAKPSVLVIQERVASVLPPSSIPVVPIDPPARADRLDNPRVPDLQPHHLAYVIYTSGSTGNPKGVMVEHRQVTRLFSATDPWFHFKQTDVWSLFHSFAFDFSVWELWGALLYGGRVVVVPYLTARSPQDFYRLLCQEGVTVLNQTPSAFSQLIQAQQVETCGPHSLRAVIFGGEALELRTLRPWVAANSLQKTRLINMYGITETTVHVTYCPLTAQQIASERGSVIGRAIPDLQFHLLDKHQQPVPVGVVGEIHVGGAGVARGYLNRPELTAQRFIADPFGTDPEARLYRSGDLGRWRADGAIEFLGRNDQQVKIRGFRIELGEIEAQLARHAQLKEVVVIARQDVPGDKRLVAYVTPAQPSSVVSVEALRAHLKTALPEYMVPSAIVVLERLPLTSNGKLDRRALPAPELGAYSSKQYAAPQGPVEEILAGIWQGLLAVERVGRGDNFFELGGHSLLIVQMKERLRRVRLSVEVRRVFESPTLADLASVLKGDATEDFEVPPNQIPEACEAITPQMLPLVQLEPQHIERIVQTVPGGAANIQDIYPLAPLQEGILFHHLLNQQGGDTYVLPTVLAVSSRARLEELIQALQAGIDRHDILRTAVLWESLPRPVQVVYRHAKLPVQEIALDPAVDLTEQVDQWIQPRKQRLDLRQAPLMRLQVAPDLHSGQWFVLLQCHHVACDHLTMEIVIAEAVAHLEGRAQRIPPSAPYRSHVAQALAYAATRDAETFFRSKLESVEESTAPFGLLDVRGDGSSILETSRPVGDTLARRIRAQARRLNVGAATLFHAAWGVVVARTTDRDDVVFASVLLGRMQGSAGAQRTLGMFINTLPLRLQLRGMTVRGLVEHTQSELVELLGHEQASLAVAQRCSGLSGTAPLFTALLNYRHSVPNPEAEWNSASGIEVVAKQERTNYPLTLSVDDLGAGFLLTAKTHPRVDPHRLLDYASTAMQSLIDALEHAEERPVSALQILPVGERQQVTEGFNTHRSKPFNEKFIHEVFEAQVQKTPDATALIFDAQTLSFAALNRRANQLARDLLTQGVGPDKLVALCMERSLDMVIGMLGILKAGGAYLPLDPAYPADRLAEIIDDAKPVVVLKALDRARMAAQPTHDLSAAELGLNPQHLAYVIYTSGSTGKPKGVMIEHRSVLSLWKGLESIYREVPGCARVGMNASISFDASVKQFVQLLSGRSLVVVPPDIRLDARQMLKFLDEFQLDAMDCTPLQLKLWLSAGLLQSGVHPLRLALIGGESIDPELWSQLAQSERLAAYNVYGPTESTVDTTFTKVSSSADAPHIGRTMENRCVYILDSRGDPVPLGVAGEIHIGGAGVARGYLNRPDLTAERFIPDFLSPDSQGRLYKTGDLARWRPDGAIEYLERNDHQVKVRGFRIELGEIQAQLAAHAAVAAAVVILRQDSPGEKRLVAYVTLKETRSAQPIFHAEDLRSYLKAKLPEYMIPAAFVVLDRIPLTRNGKLDRQALPVPGQDAYASRQYEAPQGELEQTVAWIWQDLLKVEKVGRGDHFFELGGHSLLIMQMMELLRRVGLSTPVRTVFDYPILRDLAERLQIGTSGELDIPPNLIPSGCDHITPQMLSLIDLSSREIDHIAQSVPGGAANIQDIYPLAPLQEGILFHHLLNEQGADTYLVPNVVSLSSRERLDALIAALQAVIDRHDILRTAVLWKQLSRPVQVVCRQAKLPVDEIPMGDDPSEWVRTWVKTENQWLDLDRAPLMRVRVAPHPDRQQWYALIQLHHITSDHVTLEIITSEVVAHLRGLEASLPRPAPYRSHVAQALAYAKHNDAEEFFRARLADVLEPTAPFGLLDIRGDGSQVREAHLDLELDVARRIRAQARALGVSAATLFHMAWGLVVARTSARDDIAFGSVLLGRLQGSAATENVLGMFINTLPLRLQLKGVSTRTLVEQVRAELVGLLAHEQTSLAVAQRCSGLAGSTPLFTSLLNYRHSVPNTAAEWSSAEGVRFLAGQERTNYPIVICVDDQGDALALTAQTDPRIDPDRITGYLATAIMSVVTALEHSPDTLALTLQILPEHERYEVIEAFNANQRAFPKEKLIHELFEEQVTRSPTAMAVSYESGSLTYAQLNAQANQLARYLKSLGVGAGDYVPVLMSRSVEMLLAELALLKCGAAYVPIDPEFPPERQAFMVKDCGARWIVANHAQPSDATSGPYWVDVGAEAELIASQPFHDLALSFVSPPVAYVMYTSGSTGVPKGVVIEHQGVNRLVINTNYFRIDSTDCVVHISNPTFDAATFEIWAALLNGARLLIVPQEVVLEASRFCDLLVQERATIMLMSVGLFNRYTDSLAAGFKGLRYLFVGGDALDPAAMRRVLLNSPPAHLLNAYGPTECTSLSTTYPISDIAAEATSIPIGGSVSNGQIYILSDYQQPVPVGVVGEIHVGGAGVARGYLNRPELTAQRFIADPFSTDPQARLYRSGDLGRWRADGAIEFLGRNDQQVKIRGFRIELGEIEAQLGRHAQLKEVVVIARQDVPGDKRLVAYVTPAQPSSVVSVEELRAHLKTALPEYMVPSAIVVLEHLPLTSNGKLDRRALPAPELGAYSSKQYAAPQGPVEEILAGIWQGLLAVERVGRGDNFFELGGHSLLIVQMKERLRRVGLSVEVRRVFESPTLADLASVLKGDATEDFEVPPNQIPEACEAITPQMLPLVQLEPQHIERIVQTVPGGAANIQDIYPLAPLQEGILFHHLLNQQGGDTYVLPTVLAVSSRARLEELIQALQAGIDRHDILRTAVLWESLPRPVQVVYRHANLPVQEIALDPAVSLTEQVDQWIQPRKQRLDLRQAPLMRLQVAPDPHSGQWLVRLQLHHIAIDGIALKALMSEIVEELNGLASPMAPPVPYRNHVAFSLAYAQRNNDEAFFRDKLQDIDEPTAPFGVLDVHGGSGQYGEAQEELDATLAARIRAQAGRLGVSSATLFHAAWSLVVAHTTGRDQVVFGTVLSGRLQEVSDSRPVVGLFINTLPLRVQLRGVGLEDLIGQVQRELVDLFGHEQASLAVAQKCSQIVGTAPLFTSLLNYRHGSRNQGVSWDSASGLNLFAHKGRTNYPITLSVDDLGSTFILKVQTDIHIDAHRVNGYLRTALGSVVDALQNHSDTPALVLETVPEPERAQILSRFNATQAEYPHEKCVHELFEEQVRLTPQSIAVTHNGRSLTYWELDARANQLALELRPRMGAAVPVVGICAQRSPEMIVGLLAILKAGGAYLPLDPNYPAERLEHMLQDAQPAIVLIQEATRAVLPPTQAERVLLWTDSLDESTATAADLPRADSNLTAQNPVYVIYTSGSTGRPKGTVMAHRSMVNLIQWHRATFESAVPCKVLQFAALSFDVAFQEIFSTLCTGGELVLLDEAVRKDPRALAELLRKAAVQRLFVPPLMLQTLAERIDATQPAPAHLRDVITAGEQLRITPEIVSLFERMPGCRLHNHYGPTETHVVTALRLEGDAAAWPALPAIGSPISNARIYILDERHQPVPLGAIGEIYIGGDCVARGYLNRAELTSQRFLRDPFSSDPAASMYKTGDLARWRPDGIVEYLGRNDFQVKIRGYRIELGEIETQLAQHPDVADAAVIAREDVPGEKRLVAYVTCPEEGALDTEELRVYLRSLLPDYMVPSAFVVLSSLPITPNGKLNRSALPAPELGAYVRAEYEPPEGDIETVLANIWEELLRVPRVGRHDNFFELGGHSLHGMRLVTTVEQRLGRVLPVSAIFQHPTIRDMAEMMAAGAVENLETAADLEGLEFEEGAL